MKHDYQAMSDLADEQRRLQQLVMRQDAEIRQLRARLQQLQPGSGAAGSSSAAPLPAHSAADSFDPFLYLVEEVFTAVIFTDPQGRAVWCNRGFTQLCGYELGQVLGQPVKRLLRRSLRDTPQNEYIDECLMQQRPFEYEVPNPVDEQRWIRVKAQPMFDNQGQLILYAGLLTDITERKTAQLRLAESEHRFRALIENAPVVFYEWFERPEGRAGFTYASPKIQEVFGMRPEQLDELMSFIHSDDLAEWQRASEASLAQRTPWSFVGRLQVPGQPLRWLRGYAVIARDDTHGLLYRGILEDVTAQRRAEDDLRTNEQRCRALVENAPVVFYEWRENFDGTYENPYVSAKLQQLFHIDSLGIEGFAQHIHPDDRLRWRQSIDEANQRRQPWHFEGRLQVPDQPLRWWRGSSLLVGEDARGLIYHGILEDITPVMQAQEAVRASEQRWRATVEAVGGDTWEYHVPSRQLQLSPLFRELLGQRGNTLDLSEGQPPIYRNLHPDDVETTRRALVAYLQGALPLYDVTYRVLGAEGEIHWLNSRGMVTERDAQGQPLLISGTHTDVTEITNARLAAESSALRLAATIGHLRRAVLLEDEYERVVLVNDEFCRFLNLPFSPEQAKGMACRKLAERGKQQFDNAEEHVRRLNEIRTQRLTVDGEIVTTKDGRIAERTSTPIYANGQYIGRLWKYEDITERKANEDALKRREEKYRGILENMNLGLVEIDLDGQIIFVNDSYCEITGYTKTELLHTSHLQLMASPAARADFEQRRHARQQGLTEAYEIPIRTKGNDLKWLLVSAAPLFNRAREVVGSIGVHLDVTHQKQLESKLREAKKLAEESARAKEMFLANMSHEIRTPMNAILGMSQLLSKTPLTGQQNNYLHAISSSAENLLVIINDILDLSKIDAGKMTIERIGFSLRKVCEQVEKTLRYKAEDKGLTLRVRVCPDLPDVLLGDPYRITQVLLNLAGNSIKFTEKGEVEVCCELAGTVGPETVVEFRVADTGIGIDAQYLRRLFQNFSQEDTSVSRKYGGTGLGLSISRSLVHLMGGEIQIESEKNRGTTSTFSLLLPIGSVADLPRQEVSGSALAIRESLRGKRVLLVEDNEYNRVLAMSFLRQAHIEVAEAENGAVAVELAREQAFDLVLMDVQMPVMNGYEATQQLRHTLGLQLPIIALTANAIRGDNQKCLEAGMNDYLSKPFHEDELLKIVHEWLLCVPTRDASTKLYRLDLLREAAHNDQKFMTFMLRTFLKSSDDVLGSLRAALATGNVDAIRAAAHKIKPSLRHLQIQPVLALAEQLEVWPAPFEAATLTPLIDSMDRLLRQVTEQISQDLDALHPEPAA